MSFRKTFFFIFVFLCTPGFLHAQQKLTIGSDAAPPLSTPQQTGMLDLIVREAFSMIGVTAEITHLPSERSLINANNGITDGDLVRIDGLSRMYPNLIKIPETICDFDFVAFSKTTDIKTIGWKSLKPYSVGIITGWKILEENVQASPLIKVENPGLLFGLLEKNRADLVIYNKLEGYGVLKQKKLQDIKVLEPPLETKKMFLYLHKKHSELRPSLADALKKMKQNGSFQDIRTKSLAPYLLSF